MIKIIWKVGQIATNLDCTVKYICKGSNEKALSSPLEACKRNAVCNVYNNTVSCICKNGYYGSPENCIEGIK